MASILLPNKLGWITSMEISHGVNTPITGKLEFMADDTGLLMKFMNDLRKGRDIGPTLQKEFMCLHCGTPNKIEYSFCQQCGAPRSFIIG